MFLSLEMQSPGAPAPVQSGQTDDAAWEAALAAALTPALSSAKPSETFVAQLGRRLTETARRDAEAQQIRGQRLRLAGLAGGVVSLVGGLVFWLLWRQSHRPQRVAEAKPGWTWGWKPLSRAPHPLNNAR